jgi:hypothetical protein
MNWQQRDGQRYLYRNRRRDGKVVTEYLGAGETAERRYEDEQVRQSAAAAAAVSRRAEAERWQHALDLADAFGDKVRQIAHSTLCSAGYHQHARSTWRRRRKMTTAMEATPATEAPETSISDEEIYQRAVMGDEAVRPLLGDLFSRQQELHRDAGNLGVTAELTWVALAAKGNLILEASVPAHMAKLKAELAGPEPTPLERLLVDQVVLAWLQSNCAAIIDGSLAGLAGSSKEADDAQMRHDRAQKRYLSALKTLATVRKLLRPFPSTLDLLMRNVGETSVPESIKNRGACVPVCAQ